MPQPRRRRNERKLSLDEVADALLATLGFSSRAIEKVISVLLKDAQLSAVEAASHRIADSRGEGSGNKDESKDETDRRSHTYDVGIGDDAESKDAGKFHELLERRLRRELNFTGEEARKLAEALTSKLQEPATKRSKGFEATEKNGEDLSRPGAASAAVESELQSAVEVEPVELDGSRASNENNRSENLEDDRKPRESEATRLELAILATLGRDAKMGTSQVYVEQLREQARRAYLETREAAQIELAERITKDEEQYLKVVDKADRLQEGLATEKRKLATVKGTKQQREATSLFDKYDLPAQDEKLEDKFALLGKSTVLDPASAIDAVEDWEANVGKQATFASHKPVADEEGDAVEAKAAGSEEKIQFIGPGGVRFAADVNILSGIEAPEGDWWSQQLEEREQNRVQEFRTRRRELLTGRKALPVYIFRVELLQAIKENNVLIVVGETGSGKTTQIPQFLDEVGYSKIGRIGCTQPRRVAAMSVAARVAEEKCVEVGKEVGYTVRFDNATTDRTRIQYLTDGALLQQFLTDPQLLEYSCIMVDEAHERSVHTDILLALLKDLVRHREDDFRLLISSATLEAERFSEYFDGAPIIKIPGRKYPVELFYTKEPEGNYIESAAQTVLHIHKTQPRNSGDVLVFLPGQQEIEECQRILEEAQRAAGGDDEAPTTLELAIAPDLHGGKGSGGPRGSAQSVQGSSGQGSGGLGSGGLGLVVLPMYSALASDEQLRVFAPVGANERKVVLATNIAETSITIENVVYVVDSGLVRENTFDPRTSLERLHTVNCSRAAANQRAGRAGRVKAGKCFRLYTRKSFETEMLESNVPEIRRCNIYQVILLLKAMGIDDLLHFDFFDAPATETLRKGLELLYSLGALNHRGSLTKIGLAMSQLAGSPQLAKMILTAAQLDCLEEALQIAAMLEVAHALFFVPRELPAKATVDYSSMNEKRKATSKELRDFQRQTFLKYVHWSGDHMTFCNIYDAWKNNNFDERWCYANCVQQRALLRARDVIEQYRSMLENIDIPSLELTGGPKLNPNSNSNTESNTNSNNDHTINGEKSKKLDVRKKGVERKSEVLSTSLLRALTAGFFLQTAKLHKQGRYRTFSQPPQIVDFHPRSALAVKRAQALEESRARESGGASKDLSATLGRSPGMLPTTQKPDVVIYNELVQTSAAFMRVVTAVDASVLIATAPAFFQGGLDAIAKRQTRLKAKGRR